MSALLKEVAAILAEQGSLPCSVQVGADDGTLHVTITVDPPIGMLALSLRHELEYLAGLDQVRRFAELYGIESERLEALLPPRPQL